MSNKNPAEQTQNETPTASTPQSTQPSGADPDRRPRPRWIAEHRKGLAHALLATAAATAVAAAVLGLSGISGASSLPTSAHAATTLGGQVLHEVDVENDARPRGYSTRTEGWLFPADGRARVIAIWGYKGTPFVTEWIVTSTGRVFGRVCLSYCHPASFVNRPGGWRYEGTERALRSVGFGLLPTTLPGEYARDFRAAYRAGAVEPDGTATFAGERVNSFLAMESLLGARPVYWRPGTPPPATVRTGHGFDVLVAWYVERSTAQLAGFKLWGCMTNYIRSCERRQGGLSTTRIVRFQRLDPTPQNLAELTGPGAPRGAR